MAFLLCVILAFSLPLKISANVLKDQECDHNQGEKWLGGGQVADYAACKKSCNGTPRCQSITFYDSGGCSLFSTKCEKTKYSANARSERVRELAELSGTPNVECDVNQGEKWLSGGPVADYAACKKSCEAEPKCQSVTFYDSNECSLFLTKCEKTKPKPNARSELVRELAEVKESGVMYGVECDVDQGEIYLAGPKEPDFAACKKSCEDDAQCQSVTFYDHGGCSLFATQCDKTKPSPNAKSKVIRERKQPPPEQCEIDGTCTVSRGEECDRGQGELFLQDGSGIKTYAECKQACMDRIQCQSITYYSSIRTCSLFKTHCKHRKPCKDAVAVTLKADYFNAQECDTGAGEAYLGSSSTNAATVVACRKSCEDAQECRSTTFFKSGWCSHYSTCCEKRKPSPSGQADAVKSAQCVDRCVVENGGCDGKRKCTSTRGVATCGNCRAPFINDGATGCKNPAVKKDPCKTNNGGCHGKRKCTSKNGRVTCGNCPAGYVNNGVNSCSEGLCARARVCVCMCVCVGECMYRVCSMY